MRWRVLWVWLFLVLGLLFSILTLTAGIIGGIGDATIATFEYDFNYTVLYPQQTNNSSMTSYEPTAFAAAYQSEILAFYFNVHYLSLCAGWMGTDGEEPMYVNLECAAKPLGWTFRTDDSFIVNYGAANGSFPVVIPNEIQELHTKIPASLLIIGMVVSSVSISAFGCDRLGVGVQNGRRNMAIASMCLMVFAAAFLTTSGVALTQIINGNTGDQAVKYRFWASKELGFSWAAVGFMYAAVATKMAVDYRENAQRRTALTPSHV